MKHLFVLAALLLFAVNSHAAEMRPKDGSVAVGTLFSLLDGEDLIVDTEYMDEVTIEWDAIADMRGTQVVDVEFFDGRRIPGTVTFGASYTRKFADQWRGFATCSFESDEQQNLDGRSLLSFAVGRQQSNRYRTQFDATLSLDLFADLDFRVIACDRYDSQPPAGNDKNDSGITLALSLGLPMNRCVGGAAV